MFYSRGRLISSGHKGKIQKGGIDWRRKCQKDSFFDPSKIDLISFKHFHRALDRTGLHPYFFQEAENTQ